MTDRSLMHMAPLARWSSRIAVFSAGLLLVGIVLHRLTSFPTPVALNLFRVSLVGGGLAILVGLVALFQIWRRGYLGTASAAVGILLPILAWAWPLTYVPTALRTPPINDVTTDLSAPPRFVVLLRQRGDGANPAAYPSARFAEEQQKAYPDLRTFILDRSAQEAFELVEDAVRKLKWKVVVAEPPLARPARAGTLEATDQTLVVGFVDDIVIRVEGSAARARVDVRSASRYGTHDLGQNAARVRRFLTELQARADSIAPAGVAGRRALSTSRALVRRVKERDQRKAASRNARDPAQSSAQRARAQKELQR